MPLTPNSFAQKTAIVFAGSRGMGRATALKLGRLGARTVVGFSGNKAKAEEVVAEIEKADGSAVALQADVSDAAAVRKTFDAAEAEFGPVDIVVNAAGISVFGPMNQLTEEDLHKVFAVNTFGAFNVLSEAARRVAEGGSIVQFCSGATKMPLAGAGVYSASKAAAEQMTLSLAKELGSRQISVNAISPGTTKTDGLVMPDEHLQMLIHQTPFGRLGEPEDVADVVVFLVSPEGHWINAQNIQANGGIL